MRAQFISVDDREYKVYSLRVGSSLWLHTDGQTWVVDGRPQSKRKSSKTGHDLSGSGDIHAPMPGKVLKLNVKSGDEVRAKQALVVMEAMKMEYTLSAPFDASVKKILCEENQQVDLNQILLQLEKNSAPPDRETGV